MGGPEPPEDEQPQALGRAGEQLGRKGPRGPGGHQLNMGWQRAVAAKKANGILGCTR